MKQTQGGQGATEDPRDREQKRRYKAGITEVREGESNCDAQLH